MLRQHPQVQEAVVQLVEGGPDKQVVAYVVETSEEPLAKEELRSWLAERLPNYMLPAYFVELAALPLTPNGKVDRKGLLSLAPARGARETAFVAARTAAEEVLTDIWAEVLHLERIGVYDNFFAIGGHSLLATQIASRIRRIFQVELPLRTLFESPTIDGLVNEIAHRLGGREIIEEIAQTLKEIEQLTEEEMLNYSLDQVW